MDWKRYFSGYVEVKLSGENLEGLINEALVHDLALWDISRLKRDEALVVVPLYHLWPFIRLSRNRRCRLSIQKRGGFPFVLGQLKQRKGLLVGASLFFVLAYLGTSFLWSYEVMGNERLSDAQIVKMVQDYGVVPGRSMYNIDFVDLQSRFLIDHDDDFSWITFGREGTKLLIKVQERSLSLSGDLRPAHLVARHDGVIKNVLVMKGTALVKKNTSVKAGDILIAGEEYHQRVQQLDGTYIPAGEPELVRAKGIVQGEVIYRATGICPLQEEIIKESGAIKKQVVLRYNDQEFLLKGDMEKPFELFRTEIVTKNLLHWQDYDVSIQWIATTYFEQQPQIKEYTLSEAYHEAEVRAKEKLQQKLGNSIELIKENVTVDESPSAEIVQVTVEWLVSENLAEPQLIRNK